MTFLGIVDHPGDPGVRASTAAIRARARVPRVHEGCACAWSRSATSTRAIETSAAADPQLARATLGRRGHQRHRAGRRSRSRRPATATRSFAPTTRSSSPSSRTSLLLVKFDKTVIVRSDAGILLNAGEWCGTRLGIASATRRCSKRRSRIAAPGRHELRAAGIPRRLGARRSSCASCCFARYPAARRRRPEPLSRDARERPSRSPSSRPASPRRAAAPRRRRTQDRRVPPRIRYWRTALEARVRRDLPGRGARGRRGRVERLLEADARRAADRGRRSRTRRRGCRRNCRRAGSRCRRTRWTSVEGEPHDQWFVASCEVDALGLRGARGGLEPPPRRTGSRTARARALRRAGEERA